VDAIRMVCRAHNQYLAEKMYGRAFMDEKRGVNLSRDRSPPAVGASPTGPPA